MAVFGQYGVKVDSFEPSSGHRGSVSMLLTNVLYECVLMVWCFLQKMRIPQKTVTVINGLARLSHCMNCIEVSYLGSIYITYFLTH